MSNYRPRKLAPDEAAQAALDGDLITATAAALMVNVRPGTLNRWIDRGRLPYLTVTEGKRPVRMVRITDVSELEHTNRHRRQGE